MLFRKKYKVDRLHIIKCGRYYQNRDVLCCSENHTVTLNGSPIEHYTVNYYRYDYDYDSEYLTIGLFNKRTHNYYDLINHIEIKNWQFHEFYKYGDSGYNFIDDKHHKTIFVRTRQPLESKFDFEASSYPYNAIRKCYDVLIGKVIPEPKPVKGEIKDNILSIILSLNDRILTSSLLEEKKQELSNMLFNLAHEYVEELKRLSQTSSSFLSDKLELRKRTTSRIADIEACMYQNKTDICENDIVIFERKFQAQSSDKKG